MSQESWQPCWRHIRNILDQIPCSLHDFIDHCQCLLPVWGLPRILVLFFFLPGKYINWTCILWRYLPALLALLAHQILVNCSLQRVLSSYWCPETEPLIAEDLLWKETVQPILSWEDTYLLITVTKLTFSKDLPRKGFHSFPTAAVLTILVNDSVRLFFDFLFGCFPCPVDLW